MVTARALPARYQVEYEAGPNTGRADTVKGGRGGTTAPRPHELLEAALASCITMTARMALDELGLPDVAVTARVGLDREETATRFRYRLAFDPPPPADARAAVLRRVERSPVRRTLSRPLSFVAEGALAGD
ncbi:OsmC family protein [Actinomadura montaniterrae]|uniref:OsmC family protein n=1 Tax=Actinomadura montaniterrae TaxID=1803903 RepID=A0A6L3VE59_9ACTN|nr:OsmC family protein [Actinomadura montaniterrae]KAB2362959.1 OsmC family protein [Actinomadura montaniterrae]